MDSTEGQENHQKRIKTSHGTHSSTPLSQQFMDLYTDTWLPLDSEIHSSTMDLAPPK